MLLQWALWTETLLTIAVKILVSQGVKTGKPPYPIPIPPQTSPWMQLLSVLLHDFTLGDVIYAHMTCSFHTSSITVLIFWDQDLFVQKGLEYRREASESFHMRHVNEHSSPLYNGEAVTLVFISFLSAVPLSHWSSLSPWHQAFLWGEGVVLGSGPIIPSDQSTSHHAKPDSSSQQDLSNFSLSLRDALYVWPGRNWSHALI